MKLAYDDWRKNKEKNYPFAGYTVEIDSLSNAPLTNGGTYTINLGTETRLYNEPYWVITSRTIHYVKYGLTGSDSVASPDVIQEGHSNVTSSKNNPVVNNFNLEKDGHHYVSYETVQRSYNVASGIPDGMTDNKGNMNSIIIFDGQINPTITDWVTPDPDVTQTKSPGKNLSNKIPTNGESYNYLYRKFYHHNYYDKDGNFHQKTYLPNNEGEPITYSMLKDLENKLKMANNHFTSKQLWNSYAIVNPAVVRRSTTKEESDALTNIIQLVRFAYHQIEKLDSVVTTSKQYFNLWLGQTQRNITDKQREVISRIVDYIASNGACTIRDIREDDATQAAQMIRAFGNMQKADEALHSLYTFVVLRKSA